MNLTSEKNMDADYANVESPEGMDKMQRAFDTVNNNISATQEIINILVFTASSVLSFAALFSIISTLSPVLLAAMVALTAAQYFVNRAGHRWKHRNTENWTPIDRKLSYIDRVSGDFERAKDIRIYDLKTWLRDIFSITLGKRAGWYKKSEKAAFAYYDANQSVIQIILCNGLTFLFLISNVTKGTLTIADAVFYLSAAGMLAGVIMDVVNGASQLNAASLSICYLREFLDMPDLSNRGKGAPLPGSAVEIEFEDVSFAYPASGANVVDGMSFKIRKGEKIAIVGKNGAGKTTLVKLISGLYRPSNGKITINGREIYEYNRDEYFSLISAVFQDIYLFPVSIAQNIALCEEKDIDERKFVETVRSAGLKGKLESLPEGENTLLLKGVLDGAVELSGGEKQKLALARALYKDGPLLILDEPTAALDPIAENEMYLKYNEFTKGRTSVFISHRLSSTRFCDRIFYIDEGKIAGTLAASSPAAEFGLLMSGEKVA
jgi:ABC-type multidrug transport system fused ATPase/permease subunit